MIKRIRRELHHVRRAEPGTRFEEGYERTRVRNHVGRLALIVLGVTLMIAAAATFLLPGPNVVIVLAGLLLVAGQSRTIARWLDRLEVASRRWHEQVWTPYPHKRAVQVTGIVVVAVAALGIGWYAWRQGWIPWLD